MDHITQIPLSRLHESPFNPRKFFDPVALQELAEDIKAHGRILSPLLVRPRVPPLFQDTDDADAVTGYELVFGHRRLRASELAGLQAVDCMVRSMTDIEVKRAQISENLQRQDVHAIEEAEGFQALINEHGETADTLAASTGKSRSYVYGRIKLLQAVPKVREACLAGDVDPEVALLISRLRTTKLQEHALNAITGKNLRLEDGGKKSFRSIRELLVENYTLELKGALFSIDDATLVPAAGDCVSCPKRAGNAPEFQDLTQDRAGHWSGHKIKGNADVCTDPDCFAAKKTAQLKRDASALRDRGETVIDGNKARAVISAHGEVKGAYVALDKVKAALKASGKKPEIISVQNPRDGKVIKVVKLDSVPASAAPAAAPRYGNHDWEAERREREDRAKLISTERRGLFAATRRRIAASERTGAEARIVAWHMIDSSNEDDLCLVNDLWQMPEYAGADDWLPKLANMTLDEIARLMLDMAMAPNISVNAYSVDDEAEGLKMLSELHGAAIPTPSTAAHAQEDAADGAAADGQSTAARADAEEEPAAAAAGEESQMDDAGSAGEERTDEAGVAGEIVWPFPRRADN
jgi:ParB/RepB/Spo0J family partition protein